MVETIPSPVVGTLNPRAQAAIAAYEDATPMLEEHARIKTEQERIKAEQERIEQEKWQAEIRMLERRVEKETVRVELSNGDGVMIRACLSEAETTRLGTLQKRMSEIGEDDETAEERTLLMFEILGMVTANPYLTKEWFANNRDKYAQADLLKVSLGFYANIAEQAKAAQNMPAFRSE